MHDHDLSEADARDVGRRVREELARRRMSRQALADMARISVSTLEKALAGARAFTLSTTLRLEDALGTSLRSASLVTAVAPTLSADSMGAYSRPAVRWLEGRYLTIRPSFGTVGAVYTYLIDIRWDVPAGHLVFAESKRLDTQFEQAGHVSLPNLSGHIYLVTNEAGQYRLMVLGRPTINGTLYGLLTTLEVGQGSQLVPAACPIALLRYDHLADPTVGLVEAGMASHGPYREALDAAVTRDFVRFHS